MNHEQLTGLSACTLRDLIVQGAVSPVELLEACIARIEALNPAINAITATDFDRARITAQAAQASLRRGDLPGPLHGLPLGVKDLQDTAGLLTTSGNIGRRGHVPEYDNALVARLRAAGAIVVAKTNVPDMGAGANTRNPVWGATGNPFNPLLNAGGSSGGSAAALAADLVPLATGSDTGGSLRIPAALCGVVGLRPSPGLVANDSRPLGWSVISVLGPMGRDVGDTRLLLQASAGLDTRDPLSAEQADLHAPATFPDPTCLRIAFTPDFGCCDVDPMVRRVFHHRVAELQRLGARVEPLEDALHPLLAEAHGVFDVLRAESFYAAYADTLRDAPQTLAPHVRANIELAGRMSLGDRAAAHLAQTRMARAFAALFERYDLIVAPTTPVTPFPWTTLYAEQIDGRPQANYYRWLALTYVVTLATNPALSLPCGLDEAGMPFGLQLIGRLRGDARLLDIAQVLEMAWRDDPVLTRPRPDISVLGTPRPELQGIVTHPPLFVPGGSGSPSVTAV